jgi:SNF2 family DNA or RNA helicase
MWPATAWTPSGWRVLGSLLGHFMLRRTEEVVGLPRKYETLVPCPLAPLQASWYKRLLSSDTATASVLTVSQLKTLIMQLRKICNHPRTLLGSAKDTAAAAAAGAAAAAAVSSSSSSKTPMGGGGKRGERLRQELAALTGEERMQASGKLLVLDRLLPNKDECLLPNLDR